MYECLFNINPKLCTVHIPQVHVYILFCILDVSTTYFQKLWISRSRKELNSAFSQGSFIDFMTGILPYLSGKLRRGSEYSCDEIHMGTPWACTGPDTCLTLQTSKSEQAAGFHTAVFMCSHVRRNFSFCGIDLLYNASPLLVIFFFLWETRVSINTPVFL